MLKNEMESYVRIGGRGLKNLTCAYMGVVGVRNCQNHAYVINEWPLTKNASRAINFRQDSKKATEMVRTHLLRMKDSCSPKKICQWTF